MRIEWIVFLPYMLLAGGGTLVFSLGALWPRRSPGIFFGPAILAGLGAGVASVFIRPEPLPIHDLLNFDGFSRYYILLFTAITTIILLISWRYTKSRNFGGDEFPGIVLFAALGMMLISSTSHWLIFFLGLEILSISLYILIAMYRDNSLATEAALKYFIMGAVASSFLVFGISMVYAAAGTLSLPQSLNIADYPDSRFLLLLGLVFILVGIGFKVSLVPFHLWTPDVYQGAPAPVTAFLATGAKVALFSFLVRLALNSPESLTTTFFPFLWTTAALTMTVGNITALVQKSVKRLLAYSSIAHMGYLLMALLAVGHGGAAAVLFYSAVYAVSDLGAFGSLGFLSPRRGDLDRLEDFRGLGYSQPKMTALFGLSLFSLAGLPTTAGFIGKFVIFQAAFARGLAILGLLGIINAIISMFYYLKVVTFLYMKGETEVNSLIASRKYAATIAGLLLAVMIFWFGLFPSSLLSIIGSITGGW